MASAALVVGLSILAYFMSFSSGYSQQVDLFNLLNYEAANQIVRLITYDNVSNVVWLLLRRLDNTPRNFLLFTNTDTSFLGCANIYIYDESRDADGILCNEDSDCLPSCTYGPRYVRTRDIVVLTKDGLIPLSDYLKSTMFESAWLIRIPYLSPATGQGTRNLIVRLNLGESRPENLRVFLCVEHEGRYYVVRIFEVGLR